MSELQSLKTYKEINEFTRLASARLKTSDSTKETKLNACLRELLGNEKTGEFGSLSFLTPQFEKERRKIYRKYAGVDEKGFLLKDAHSNYVYTKENEVKCEDELDELLNRVVIIDPCFCLLDELPKDILPAEIKVYSGFVIDPSEKTEKPDHLYDNSNCDPESKTDRILRVDE